ncbi:MAG: DUF2905 domain-containing protein [Thermodesulfovibrionales bacterium]
MNGPSADLGKILLITGVIISLVGVALLLSGKVTWIGRLPGDIMIKRRGFTFYFPLATSILASVIVSLILYLISRR